jgi:transcriptional regulator with XRE-family HTH domain
MTNREVGLRLTRLREAHGLTTVTLGRKVGLSQAQISRLENGKQGFRLATLVRLADALGVPGFLMLMTDEEWGVYQTGLDATGAKQVEIPRQSDGK